MRKIDYEGWAEYMHEIIQYYEMEPDKILELAAGDCLLSDFLDQYYKNIFLTDISHSMLNSSLAKNKNKVACDMTLLPFKSKIDFIFAVFDSVNYLLTEEELLKLFNEVACVLSEKGVFTFDVSLEKNSIKNVKHLNRKGKVHDLKYTQTNSYNAETRIHQNIFTLKQKNGEVLTEIHNQKIYSFEKYFEVLDKSNLYVIDCFDFFSFENANQNCERVQFVLAGYN